MITTQKKKKEKARLKVHENHSSSGTRCKMNTLVHLVFLLNYTSFSYSIFLEIKVEISHFIQTQVYFQKL